MTSQNESVNQLFRAYCEAMALDNLELHIVDERRWLSAVLAGMTPDDLKLVIKERMKGIAKDERRAACLYVRNLCGSDEAIADVMNEVAVIRARMRIKVMDKGKAAVLRATGRSDEPKTSDARPIGDYIGELRKSAGL